MDNYKLTITFSDGEVVTEKFRTEVGMERAIRGWKEIEAEDRNNGETYSIVSLEPEELNPSEVEELV
jgi:carbamoylphosphate synthase large subunit